MIMALKWIRREIMNLARYEIKIERKGKSKQNKPSKSNEINESYYAYKTSSIQRTNFRFFR